MADKVRILVVGVGNMGASHAKAYHRFDGFEIIGLMSRSVHGRNDLPEELNGYPRFGDFDRSPFGPASRKQLLVCAAA